MIQDITQVQDLENYIEQILKTELTQEQLEIATSTTEIENLLRHVPFIWRRIFMNIVQERGFTGIMEASEAGDELDKILTNENVIQFVQILLVLFFSLVPQGKEPEE
jgi:hypothetical protein